MVGEIGTDVVHTAGEQAGTTVAIQGYGAVGRHSARFLAERDAIIVAASDSRGTIVNEAGLDLAKLDAAKQASGSVADADCGEVRDRVATVQRTKRDSHSTYYR